MTANALDTPTAQSAAGTQPLYDFLSPADQRAFPLASLHPQAQALLSKPLPADLPEPYRSTLSQKLAKALPNLTPEAVLRRRMGNERKFGAPPETPSGMLSAHATAANQRQVMAMNQAEYDAKPLYARIGRQGMEGVAEAAPSSNMTSANGPAIEGTPEPKGFLERGARLAGNVGTFAAETAALAPVLGPLAPGAVVAMQRGTPAERAIGGVTMTAAGVGSGLMGRAVEKVVGSAFGKGAASTIAKKATGAVIGAGTFGIYEPSVRGAVEGKPTSGTDMARSSLDLLAVNAISSLFHGKPSPAAQSDATESAPAETRPETPVAGVRPVGPGGTGEKPPVPDAAGQNLGTPANRRFGQPLAVFRGATPTEAYKALKQHYIDSGQSERDAGDKALVNVAAARTIERNLTPPPGGTPDHFRAAEPATTELQGALRSIRDSGAPVTLKVGDQALHNVQFMPELTRVYPWSDQQIRTTVVDGAGRMYPVAFPNHESLTAATERPNAADALDRQRLIAPQQQRIDALQRAIANDPGSREVPKQQRRLSALQAEVAEIDRKRDAAKALEARAAAAPQDKQSARWLRRAATMRAELEGQAPKQSTPVERSPATAAPAAEYRIPQASDTGKVLDEQRPETPEPAPTSTPAAPPAATAPSDASPGAAEGTGRGSPADAKVVRAQSIHMMPNEFQPRDGVNEHGVNPERLQTHLEQHQGYNAEKMAEKPVTTWTDKAGEVGPKDRTYVLDGHHRLHIAQHTWERQGDQWVSTGVSDRDVAHVEVHGPLAEAQAHVASSADMPSRPEDLLRDERGSTRIFTDLASSLRSVFRRSPAKNAEVNYNEKGQLDIPADATADEIRRGIEWANARIARVQGNTARALLVDLRDRLNEKLGLASHVPPEALGKFTDAIKKMDRMRGQQEEMYTAERGKRIGRAKAVARTTSGEAGFKAELHELGGQLPKMAFESVRGQMKQPEIDALFDAVKRSARLSDWEKITARDALRNMLRPEGATLPTEGELGLLGHVFGDEFVNAVLSKHPQPTQLQRAGRLALQLPMALKLVGHLTAPGIQGGTMVWSKPAEWMAANVKMVKAFTGEDNAQGVHRAIEADPDFGLYLRSGGRWNRLGEVGGREEYTSGKETEKLPVVGRVFRASNRGFTTWGNSFRFTIWKNVVDGMRAAGDDPMAPSESKFAQTRGEGGSQRTATKAEDAARYINNFTGSGELPKSMESRGDLLRSLLFGPRLLAGHIRQLTPSIYMQSDPYVRREAITAAVRFAAGVSSALLLASVGGAKVATDPNDPDFLKIKAGNTHIDPSAGTVQYVRMGLLLGQWLTGNKDSKSNQTMLDTLLRFGQGKLTPNASLAADVLRGKTFVGDELTPANVADELFSPMVAKDVYALMKEYGMRGLLAAPLPVFGIPTHTYEPHAGGGAPHGPARPHGPRRPR